MAGEAAFGGWLPIAMWTTLPNVAFQARPLYGTLMPGAAVVHTINFRRRLTVIGDPTLAGIIGIRREGSMETAAGSEARRTRRVWAAETKAAIVAEALSGEVVATSPLTLRCGGMHEPCLFAWRHRSCRPSPHRTNNRLTSS